MPEAAELAVEAKEKDRAVALIIAILALLLALSEAGAKKAQHISTEKNIEASGKLRLEKVVEIEHRIEELRAAAAAARPKIVRP